MENDFCYFFRKYVYFNLWCMIIFSYLRQPSFTFQWVGLFLELYYSQWLAVTYFTKWHLFKSWTSTTQKIFLHYCHRKYKGILRPGKYSFHVTLYYFSFFLQLNLTASITYSVQSIFIVKYQRLSNSVCSLVDQLSLLTFSRLILKRSWLTTRKVELSCAVYMWQINIWEEIKFDFVLGLCHT